MLIKQHWMDDKEATLGKISKTYCLLNKYRIKKVWNIVLKKKTTKIRRKKKIVKIKVITTILHLSNLDNLKVILVI